MRVLLPCKLGEIFETMPDRMGKTYRARLTGFDRGMGSIAGYDSPTLHCKKINSRGFIGETENTSFLHIDSIKPAYEILIPDHLMKLHPIGEHGISSKAAVELCGVYFTDDKGVQLDFIYPGTHYQHKQFSCPDLEQYLWAAYDEPSFETEVTEMRSTADSGRLRFTDEQIEKANSVNLLELARQYGYELDYKKESRAIHAKHSGGLCFYKDNNAFKHFGSDCKGGAINFVMMEERISFVEAVKMLLGPSYEPAREAAPRKFVPPPEKKELILPKKAYNYKRAYWYLVECRGIDPSIISALMNEKKLYQGTYFNKETEKYESVCAFIGYDENGKARYCAMRGADPESTIKQDKSGSDKSIPFHMVGRSSKVYVFEAPIDAISHATLAMTHGIDWRQDHRITTGCLSDKALQWFLKQHPEITDICWGYDNDIKGRKPVPITQTEYNAAVATNDNSVFIVEATGKPMKHIPYNWGQMAALENARKYKGLGYRVSIHTPESNDFNEDLVTLRNRATVRESETQEETEDDMEIG